MIEYVKQNIYIVILIEFQFQSTKVSYILLLHFHKKQVDCLHMHNFS